MRTVETIMQYLEEAVKNKTPIPPSDWLDASQRLVVLLGDETDVLLDLQQAVNQEKVNWIEQGKTATEAKLRAEAGETYKLFCCQRAKISRVEELIRISKIQARLRMEEYKY